MTDASRDHSLLTSSHPNLQGSRPEYDPSVPGAGAQRVVGITQLYVRLTNSYPLTIIVVDALCLVFGAGGATATELASYLALSETAVLAALEGIPRDMRCTSADLEDAPSAPSDARRASRAVEDPYYDGDDMEDGSANTLEAKRQDREEVRYYLNYKRILSVAYAHLSHMLLALCLAPLPDSPYTTRLKRSQADSVMAARIATAAVTAGGGDADTVEGLMSTMVNISPALRRKEALEGVYCPGCQFYLALQDFAKTASRCPMCQQNVLELLVLAIKRKLDAEYVEEGRSLVVVPGAGSPTAGHSSRRSTQATVANNRQLKEAAPTAQDDNEGNGKPSGESAATGAAEDDVTVLAVSPVAASRAVQGLPLKTELKPQGIDCPLARDPFLVQQALAFLFLYSTPFACLSDARCVVDPDSILTEPEYENRLRGRASVADEFRALHRNAHRVRVRLVSQKKLDEVIREENARKIAKRSNLPPWLKHSTTLASLEVRSGTHSSADRPFQGHPDLFPFTNNTTTTAAADDDEAPARKQPVCAASEMKRAREATSVSAVSPREALLSQAHFVATEFFENDYDAVPLPRYRPRRQ